MINLKIQKNIYKIFIISIIIPFSLLTLLISIYYNNKTVSFYKQNISSTLFSVAKNIEISFNEIERVSFSPYLNKDIFSTMVAMKNGFMEQPVDFIDTTNLESIYTSSFTKLLHSSSQKIKSIGYYPMHGQVDFAYLISSNKEGIQREPLGSTKNEPWFCYAQTIGKEIHFLSNTADRTSSTAYYSAVRPIIDFDNNKKIGILKIDFSSDNILSILNKIQVTPNSMIALVDGNNQIVYSSNPAFYSPEMLFNKSKVIDPKTKSAYYTISQKIDNTSWRVICLLSENDIILSNSKTTALFILVTIFTLFIAFVIYKYKSNRIIYSMDSIINTIHKIEKGNLNARCCVDDENEFSVISKAINQMAKRLDHHIEKEYRAIISQKSAEYLALQTQINPHFLYNTLNGFIALNRMGEKDLLEQSILKLTKLFRYTCKNSNTSTLKEECDFISNYLMLQQLRFDDRLYYKVSIEPEAEEVKVPKLFIQPLVENSIVHGMEPDESPITITITGEIITNQKNKKCLKVVIQDDGLGFDKNKLDQLGNHVGLVNVENRLAFFHNQSTFQIESKINKGTTCIITFPIEPKKEP